MAAETVLFLNETPSVVLGEADGVRVAIQRVYGGISICAEKIAPNGQAHPVLTAQMVHGALTLNTQYGSFLQVKGMIQDEVQKLRLDLGESPENQAVDNSLNSPETNAPLSLSVPAAFARARNFFGNLR